MVYNSQTSSKAAHYQSLDNLTPHEYCQYWLKKSKKQFVPNFVKKFNIKLDILNNMLYFMKKD